MKVYKDTENRVILEGEELKGFDTKVKSKTGLKNSSYDKEYSGLILIYRNPNMDASKQIITCKNKISIMTMLSSVLHNLVKHKVISKSDVLFMVDAIFTKIDIDKEEK